MLLSVLLNKDDMMITGLSDAVAANTEVELNCTVNKIKPKAIQMYFVINGKRVLGNITTNKNLDGKTLKQTLTRNYK